MTRPEGGGKRGLQLGLGLAISALLIWLAFRNTPFADVWDRIIAMRPLPMVAAVILATLPFALRVPRWSLLLRHSDGSPIPEAKLWHAIAIGFAANNVLPFRLGEVLRMGAISRLAPVPFPSALASVAVERVLDALVAVGLLASALLLIDLPPGSSIAAQARIVGVLALAALAVAIAVARWPWLATGPIEAILRPSRFRNALVSVVARLAAGIGALSDPRRALAVLAWSLAVWLTNAAAFWAAFAAFGIEVSFAGALVLQGALMIGIALPSSPGYVGLFEMTIVIALSTFFGVPNDVGLAYAISYHVLTFVPITVLGAYSLLSTGLSVGTAREAAS
ncbi:MAG TPA: lysylphosphatidylglycerol synthase transmembrane domain-containing protein [Gemmatimonadales bacterium]|nr:lysylphosphatidylglycerol synthase transmembrane domain-containing protein [Gemmatimonadales bacterium]